MKFSWKGEVVSKWIRFKAYITIKLLHPGDHDGDGKDDLICVSAAGGVSVLTAVFEDGADFNNQAWQDDDFDFCTSESGEVKLK